MYSVALRASRSMPTTRSMRRLFVSLRLFRNGRSRGRELGTDVKWGHVLLWPSYYKKCRWHWWRGHHGEATLAAIQISNIEFPRKVLQDLFCKKKPRADQSLRQYIESWVLWQWREMGPTVNITTSLEYYQTYTNQRIRSIYLTVVQDAF